MAEQSKWEELLAGAEQVVDECAAGFVACIAADDFARAEEAAEIAFRLMEGVNRCR